MSTPAKDRAEIKRLRKERKLAKKAGKKLRQETKKAKPKSKPMPKKRGRKNGKSLGKPNPVSRVFRQIRRVDEAEAKAFAAHLMFPEWIPPVRVPDSDPSSSAMFSSKWEESSVTLITDSTATTNAYFGIAVGVGCTAQFYRISASAAGVWTWTAFDNPKAGSLTSNTSRVRNLGCNVQLRNIASLSTLQGRWMVARVTPLQGQSATGGGPTTVLPASLAAFTGLRTFRECAANMPDADGISISHVPVYSGTTSSSGYFQPTDTLQQVNCGFTIIVWAGSASSTIQPNIIPTISTSFEFVPYQSVEWLFGTQSWIGGVDLANKAFEAAIEMWSACGCTNKERQMFFKQLFGREAPKSGLDIGNDATVGIAVAADEVRGRLRHLTSILPSIRELAESKCLSTEIFHAVQILQNVDLSEPEPDEKLLVTRKELQQMVREMVWLEDPPEEKKPMRSASAKPR